MAFGLFQVTARKANHGVDPYVATFTIIMVSLSVLASFAFTFEEPGRLLDAPISAVLSFALAGVANFFSGWTCLALAQQRIGAGRTSVVAGTAPLFGTAIAFLALGESVAPVALVGVVLVVVGIGMLASGRTGADQAGAVSGPRKLWGLTFALLTALSWGASAVLARHGLAQVAVPLSGVSVGLSASAVLYAAILLVRRLRRTGAAPRLARRSVALLGLAGVLVATGIGTQWIAIGLAPVAIVLALNQLSVPVVLAVAPVVIGTPGERLTRQGLLGAALAVVGSLLLIAARS